jgi:hypothetical protein
MARQLTHGDRSGRRRVLLVGCTRAMLRMLETPIAEVAQVSAVPFPSPAFDRVAREIRPHLVIVDVTYLSEERVRPLMMERFAEIGSVLVFISGSGAAWTDDLRTRCSGPLESTDPSELLGLVAAPPLRLVQA